MHNLITVILCAFALVSFYTQAESAGGQSPANNQKQTLLSYADLNINEKNTPRYALSTTESLNNHHWPVGYVFEPNQSLTYQTQLDNLNLSTRWQGIEKKDVLIALPSQINASRLVEWVEGYDVTLQYNLLDEVNLALEHQSIELDHHDPLLGEYRDKKTKVSVHYGQILEPGLYASAAVSIEKNRRVDNSGVLIDSRSSEIVLGYGFNNLVIYGGYQIIEEVSSKPSSIKDDDHELSSALLGIKYYWADAFNGYIEAKVDDGSSTHLTNGNDDMFLMGLTYSL
jgi:hypothetical protein